jgi:hypothetical protein
MFLVNPADSGSSPAISRAAPRLPRRVVISAIGSLVFFMITIATLFFGLSGAQGPQGLPGPAGPPGPPGPQGRPATAATLEPAILLLARSVMFNKDLVALTDAVSKYTEAVKNKLESYTKNQAGVMIGSRRAMTFDPISAIEAQVNSIAKRDLGDDVTFDKHPSFDINHSLKIPGAEQITDEYYREDYRRLYDQYQTSQTKMQDIKNTLQAQIARVDQELAELVKPAAK